MTWWGAGGGGGRWAGAVRNTVAGPALQGGSKGILCTFLRQVPVASHPNQRRDDAAPLVTKRTSDGRVDVGVLPPAAVGQPHIGKFCEACVGDRLLRVLSLLAREGHTERTDAVALRGVHDHAAPAATNIEQPHPGLEPDLSGHQVELRVLRLLKAAKLKVSAACVEDTNWRASRSLHR